MILRLFVAAVAVVFSVYIFRLVAKHRLQLKYSLLWLLFAVVLVVFAIWPDPVFWLASFLGFEASSNMIFLIAIVFLSAICLSLCVIVSWQGAYIKSMVQQLAILNNRLHLNENGKEAGKSKGDSRQQD